MLALIASLVCAQSYLGPLVGSPPPPPRRNDFSASIALVGTDGKAGARVQQLGDPLRLDVTFENGTQALLKLPLSLDKAGSWGITVNPSPPSARGFHGTCIELQPTTPGSEALSLAPGTSQTLRLTCTRWAVSYGEASKVIPVGHYAIHMQRQYAGPPVKSPNPEHIWASPLIAPGIELDVAGEIPLLPLNQIKTSTDARGRRLQMDAARIAGYHVQQGIAHQGPGPISTVIGADLLVLPGGEPIELLDMAVYLASKGGGVTLLDQVMVRSVAPGPDAWLKPIDATTEARIHLEAVGPFPELKEGTQYWLVVRLLDTAHRPYWLATAPQAYTVSTPAHGPIPVP